MQKPVRAEIAVSITQDIALGRVDLDMRTVVQAVGGTPDVSRSAASIDADQLFTRIQEVLNNTLRVVCSKMEQQIKQQKGQQNDRRTSYR